MRTALEVEKKTAAKLRQLAEAQKISVEELLAAYVPGLASNEVGQNGVEAEDKAQAFEEWASSFSGDAPPLTDEAISRTSIYSGR
jgi:hypothetical protein